VRQGDGRFGGFFGLRNRSGPGRGSDIRKFLARRLEAKNQGPNTKHTQDNEYD